MISDVDIRDWDRLPEGRRLADNHVGWGVQSLTQDGWKHFQSWGDSFKLAVKACNELRLMYGKDYEFRVYEVVE